MQFIEQKSPDYDSKKPEPGSYDSDSDSDEREPKQKKQKTSCKICGKLTRKIDPILLLAFCNKKCQLNHYLIYSQ